MSDTIGRRIYSAYKSMPAQRTITANYNKRLISLNRRVNLNTGELNCYQLIGSTSIAPGTATTVNLTSISQGNDSNFRTGRRINIRGVSVHVHTNDRALDCYHINSKSGVAPTYTDFQPVIQGHIKDSAHYDFKVVKYIKSTEATTYWRYNKRYSGTQYCWYSGSGNNDVIRNGQFLTFKNDSLVTITVQYSCNVYYTDA